jgi:hypothetical protein
VIPENTLLNPDSYLVLCEDTTKFKMQFPQVKNYCGNFDFGLSSGGELVRLYEDHGGLVDSLTYDSVLPWPPEPGGMGATLALKDSKLDNSRSGSWYASPQPGTPGSRNDTEVGTGDKTVESSLPKSIHVRQNYPNPFNSETVISLELPHRNHVTIAVFDATGRKIAGLVNKTMLTGIRQVKFDNINICPNPADGLVHFDLRNEKIAHISVSDYSGKQVMNLNSASGSTIDLSELNPGIYIIRIKTAEGNYTGKVIKK